MLMVMAGRVLAGVMSTEICRKEEMGKRKRREIWTYHCRALGQERCSGSNGEGAWRYHVNVGKNEGAGRMYRRTFFSGTKGRLASMSNVKAVLWGRCVHTAVFGGAIGKGRHSTQKRR